MKKIVSLFAVYSVLFIACSDGTKHVDQTPGPADADTLTSEQWKKYPEIPKDEVKKMADQYKSLHHDINKNIMHMITMDGSLLRKLLKKRDRVRFITAAYLADNPYGKKDDVTVIIQLVSKNPGVVYYDFNAIFSKRSMSGGGEGICPPPPDCDPTSTEESFQGSEDQ